MQGLISTLRLQPHFLRSAHRHSSVPCFQLRDSDAWQQSLNDISQLCPALPFPDSSEHTRSPPYADMLLPCHWHYSPKHVVRKGCGKREMCTLKCMGGSGPERQKGLQVEVNISAISRSPEQHKRARLEWVKSPVLLSQTRFLSESMIFGGRHSRW